MHHLNKCRFVLFALVFLAAPIFAMAQRKVGFYAGTFDPPHLGHQGLVQKAIDQFQLDDVYIIVNPTPEHKPNATSFEDRWKMVSRAFDGIPQAHILSPQEANEIKKSTLIGYFWNFSSRHPQDKIFHIVGSDVLEKMLHNSKLKLPPNEILVVSARGQAETFPSALKSTSIVSLLEPDEGFSSTKVRTALKQGKLDAPLAEGVLRYIASRHLYGVPLRCAWVY